VGGLPTRLDDAGNHTLESQISETDSAEAEFTHIASGASATAATVNLPNLEFGLLASFGDH